MWLHWELFSTGLVTELSPAADSQSAQVIYAVGHGGSLGSADGALGLISSLVFAPPSISALASRISTCAKTHSSQDSPRSPLSTSGSFVSAISRPRLSATRASSSWCNWYLDIANSMLAST